jgi:hypothetical protein
MGAFHLGKRSEWVVLSLGEPEHVVPSRLAWPSSFSCFDQQFHLSVVIRSSDQHESGRSAIAAGSTPRVNVMRLESVGSRRCHWSGEACTSPDTVGHPNAAYAAKVIGRQNAAKAAKLGGGGGQA